MKSKNEVRRSLEQFNLFHKNLYLSIIIMLISGTFLAGQSEKEMIKTMMDEDRSVIDALVMYPEDTRNEIFQISTHPELLIRIQNLQTKSKEKFQAILAEKKQEEQEKFYNLLRYEGLLKDLASNDDLTGKQLDEILSKYPKEIHETGKDLYKKNFKDLQQILNLNNDIIGTFNTMIASYSEESQNAASSLIKLPETLSLLVENLNLTILIGDLYKKEPEWVRHKADSINLEIARQEAEELEDYKQQLEDDPEAYKEMLEAAEQYSSDNSIKNYNEEIDTDPTNTVTYHYSYWYGYPHWYTTPLWAPVPWYYHTGFYFGPGGGAVFIGMPSPYYMGWHYTYYPNRYVYLNSHYHRHYYRHPYSHGGFHNSVNIHINRNNNIIVNNRRNNISPRTPSNRIATPRNNDNQLGRDFKNANKERTGNVDRNNGKNQIKNQRSNIQSKPRSSYDRHKAYQNHRSNWSSRNSSGSRSMGTSRSTRRRR